MSHRVLVVDDHELWRRHICSVIRESRHWEVIGEATDGLEAVEKAEALNPDLIVLDIGLPTLNGLDAARRIVARDPGSRILFLSAHASWDIAEAALGTGARGYLVKSNAARELLPAMQAIIDGKRFITRTLAGRRVDETKDGLVTPETRRHEVAFYSDKTALLDDYSRFTQAALQTGSAVIVVTGAARRHQLLERLQTAGVDVDDVIRGGRYLSLEVADVLSAFMVDGWPDETRFWKAGISLLMNAARASRGRLPSVWASGECALTLWRDGKLDAAIQLERMWDELASTFNVDVFCPYLLKDCPPDDQNALERIRVVHSAVHLR